MQYDIARQNFTQPTVVAPASERRTDHVWMGLGLLLILLMSSRLAVADPASRDPSVAVSAAALLAAHLEVPKPRPVVRETSVENLLVVPLETLSRSDAELADESIAAAVARGTNPELVRASAFRKRNLDLFRTEREVEVGHREMLVRLRLRAATRRAMSVEVRF